jgi:DNA replication protein DnaC
MTAARIAHLPFPVAGVPGELRNIASGPRAAEIPIEALCKRLHLANAPRIYRDLAARAEQEQWAYRDLLAVLLAEEVAHRQQTRIQRLTRRARFPFLKTIDEFDFTYQSTLRLAMLGSYLSPDLVTDGRCLILTGKTGRGKTHLAIAIAYRAIQNGFDALFTTAAALVEELSVAAREGRLAKLLPTYTRPAALVIDELGYLTYGPDAANVLFHVVNERHLRKRPLLITTNKPLSEWGRVLHDPDLAQAIIDRVLERGRLFLLDGPSMRTRHLGPLDDPSPPETLSSAPRSGDDPGPAGGGQPSAGNAGERPATHTGCLLPGPSIRVGKQTPGARGQSPRPAGMTAERSELPSPARVGEPTRISGIDRPQFPEPTAPRRESARCPSPAISGACPATSPSPLAAERRASAARAPTPGLGATRTARRLNALVRRCLASSRLSRLRRWYRSRAMRRDTIKHALHTDVFVDVRPVNALTGTDEAEVGALLGCGV